MAIKIVPITGTDIQSSIKEMEILGQCDSQYVVKYFGAYYKKDHLWLVMEYCAAGIHHTKQAYNKIQDRLLILKE